MSAQINSTTTDLYNRTPKQQGTNKNNTNQQQ